VGGAVIVLYNPLSTTPGKQPLPLSVMALAAVLEARHDAWSLVDGNLVRDPAAEIVARLAAVPRSATPILAVTVMPGPQLTQAVAVCRRVKETLPHVPIVWGGYFPTQHFETVLRAPYVDFVIRSQGEQALLQLVDLLRSGGVLNTVGGLSWKGSLEREPFRRAFSPDRQQPRAAVDHARRAAGAAYHRVDMERYVHKNYLGRRTVAHNSSFGCPFACSFCAVVAMSNRRWLAQSPARIERVMRHLATPTAWTPSRCTTWTSFISEARTAEFAERIAGLGPPLVGARPRRHADAVQRRHVGKNGALGARDDLFRRGVGDRRSAGPHEQGREVVGRADAGARAPDAPLRHRPRIVLRPRLSAGAGEGRRHDLRVHRRIKGINPATEIVLYTYTPVPLDGSLYSEAKRLGFAFPETLESGRRRRGSSCRCAAATASRG
jgi:hypothetical protein